MDALIAEMAIKYKDDKKIELDQAISELKDKLANAASQLHGTTVSDCIISFSSITHSCILYSHSYPNLF